MAATVERRESSASQWPVSGRDLTNRSYNPDSSITKESVLTGQLDKIYLDPDYPAEGKKYDSWISISADDDSS